MEPVLELSMKELHRVKILNRVISGDLTQVSAAKILSLTDRQVRNLIKQFVKEGDQACTSKKRGKPSNRCLSNKKEVLGLIQKYYSDFSPKLASEYLRKNHNISISKETIRHWMISANLWFPRAKRNKPAHLPRERRHYFGELIQIDGSHHDWFEGRSSPCILMVFIDDATSTITSLHFAKTENLEAYYEALSKHLKKYGIPLGIYGDRCSTLCSRDPFSSKEATQFQKALQELNCELILAHSPEAKGRVERANRTLQDRLVKMLRIRGINSMEEASEVLEEYRQEHNENFSKKPIEQANVHRPLEGICLEEVLSIRETRTLDKKFTVQFRNNFYLISAQDSQTHLFNKAKVEVRVLKSGEVIGFIKGNRVIMQRLREVEYKVMDEKEIKEWKPKSIYHPPVTHPYKRPYYYQQCQDMKKRYAV